MFDGDSYAVPTIPEKFSVSADDVVSVYLEDELEREREREREMGKRKSKQGRNQRKF